MRHLYNLPCTLSQAREIISWFANSPNSKSPQITTWSPTIVLDLGQIAAKIFHAPIDILALEPVNSLPLLAECVARYHYLKNWDWSSQDKPVPHAGNESLCVH